MKDVEMINSDDIIQKGSNLMLIEKYRPSTLKEIVSHTDIIQTIEQFIEKKSIPHFLFHGPPGTGKTSCILAIARALYGNDFKKMVLELNASDERGINTVRDKIKEFCSSQILYVKGIKLVILDEADSMTSQAQFALRRVIEKFTKNSRFCLICNQVNKIIPAIQSRCMKFRFNPLKFDHCSQRIEYITSAESIHIEKKCIPNLFRIGKGDMRKILNTLESTNNSYGSVTNETLYMCTGLPSQDDVLYMVKVLLSQSFSASYNTLLQYKADKGFSMNDIITELGIFIRKNYSKNLRLKIKTLKWLMEADTLSNIGGNERILLSNIIATFTELKNDGWKI